MTSPASVAYTKQCISKSDTENTQIQSLKKGTIGYAVHTMHRVHYVENIQLLLCATCTVSGGRTATQKGGGLEEAGRAQDSKST